MSIPQFFVVQVWTTTDGAAPFRASARAVDDVGARVSSAANSTGDVVSVASTASPGERQ
ncbi:MAG TPA: hypothetical protein VNU71_04715 [Burkholderiaceae bacterium]|nr:hypothetical protein [Burkholderiaceae bacterium]